MGSARQAVTTSRHKVNSACGGNMADYFRTNLTFFEDEKQWTYRSIDWHVFSFFKIETRIAGVSREASSSCAAVFAADDVCFCVFWNADTRPYIPVPPLGQLCIAHPPGRNVGIPSFFLLCVKRKKKKVNTPHALVVCGREKEGGEEKGRARKRKNHPSFNLFFKILTKKDFFFGCHRD